MASTPSRTGTVNLALTRIGTSKRIASVDDGSPLALTAQAVFAPALRSTLAAHPWNFAKTRDQLAAEGEAPAFGYAFKYKLPGDCIRWLPPEPDEDIYFEGEEEGGYILTDSEAPLPICYVRLVEDAALWSPEFEQVLAYRIGLDMAYAITALREVSDLTESGFKEALAEGKRLDSRRSRRPDRSAGNHGFTWLTERD